MKVTLRLMVRPAPELAGELARMHTAGWILLGGHVLHAGQVAVLVRDGWRRPGAEGWC